MSKSDRPQNPSEFDEGMPESQEVGEVNQKVERLADYIADNELQHFWEKHPALPEVKRNGNGVDVFPEELKDYVRPKIREMVAENMQAVEAIMKISEDPRRAYDIAINMMLSSLVGRFIEESYGKLDAIKKSGIDALTGLPNFEIYKKNLRASVIGYERFGKTFSVVLIDLDHFKEVNDIYGHEAGDQVLQEVARRATQDTRLRECDAIMRIGGEEFIFILPSTPGEGACIVADRFQNCLRAEPFSITNKLGKSVQIPVTATMGVAEYEDVYEEGDAKGSDVRRRADFALYVGKGQEPDEDGVIEDRRNSIFRAMPRTAGDETIRTHQVTEDHVRTYISTFKGAGRSSFPARKKQD
ncbi:GGDEF domain-containing protein [Candidatus Peregrinibacteria bacterium]|nr:GGDEF domain-containing protein [Candidatus Peregrinibacteria bacterium]